MMALEGWRKEKLGSLVSAIGDGGTPNTNNKNYFGGSIPWVVIKDICSNICTTSTKLTENGLKSCSAKLWPSGTVVLSTGATIGEVGIASCPLATKQGIVGIVCNFRLHNQFLYFKLQSLKPFIKANAQGSTIREVRPDFLKSITIWLPEDIAEQTKIAKILSTVDRAIEQTEAIIAKQQRIKTGLMQDLLTRGIDEQGNIRSEETHEFKDSPLGRIPVEWEVVTLDNCVCFDSPICYGILMPGQGYDNGIPVIKVKDIFNGRISQNNILLTDPKIDALYKRSRLRSGDLLLTIRGTTGRVALVPPELGGANITQDTSRIRLKDKLSKEFFFFLLQSFHLQEQIQLHTLGQAVKGINIGEVKKIFFGLPSENEQENIANVLKEIEKQLDKCKQVLMKQHSLKAALMQDLLSGKVRVTTSINDKEVST